MVDKNSAPSYSIAGGKKNSFIKLNQLPGPGAYETGSHFKLTASQDKLAKQKRFSSYQTVVPGPGTYSNKKQQHVRTALFLPKSKQQRENNVPGPGSYQPDFHKIIKSNSSYKIGHSQKLTDYSKPTKFIPGPGQYDTAKSTLLGLNQAAKFGPERKIQLGYDPKTPGPGQYNNQNLHYNAQMATQSNIVFSKSTRSQSYNTLVPGPGAYLVKSQLQASLTKSKGYKMGQKISIKQKDQKLPGPGAYQSTSPNLTKKGTPSFSISKDAKMKMDNLKQLMSKPGPLSYDTKVTALQSRSFVIGKDKRKGLANESLVPGPGAYQHKTLLNNQTYSLSKSQRKPIVDQKNIPGPFQYNPKKTYNTQYENIKVGTDHRRTFEIKQQFPGPGEYKLYEQHKKQGGFKMGKQKRGIVADSKIPGPGMYNIPSTISNLPQYAVSTIHK